MSFYDFWNFKFKNITVKNSVSEKLVGVIMDNKPDFMEHLNTACERANLKLHALNRISRFLYQNLFSTIARLSGCSATGRLCIK